MKNSDKLDFFPAGSSFKIATIPAGAKITLDHDGTIEAKHADGTFETFKLVEDADAPLGMKVVQTVCSISDGFEISIATTTGPLQRDR